MWQKCPVCNGTGLVSRSPWVIGDIPGWSNAEAGLYPCQACGGRGMILAPGECRPVDTEQAEAKLQELYNHIKKHSKNLPTEYSQLVDEHFWGLGAPSEYCNQLVSFEGVKMTPKILLSALRQYRHNDNSGLAFGFDYDKTCKIVAGVEAKLRNLSEAVSEINLFFQSGNNIQVEKATITQEQWQPVQAALKTALEENQ